MGDIGIKIRAIQARATALGDSIRELTEAGQNVLGSSPLAEAALVRAQMHSAQAVLSLHESTLFLENPATSSDDTPDTEGNHDA